MGCALFCGFCVIVAVLCGWPNIHCWRWPSIFCCVWAILLVVVWCVVLGLATVGLGFWWGSGCGFWVGFGCLCVWVVVCGIFHGLCLMWVVIMRVSEGFGAFPSGLGCFAVIFCWRILRLWVCGIWLLRSSFL